MIIDDMVRIGGIAALANIAWDILVHPLLERPSIKGVFVKPNLSEQPSRPASDSQNAEPLRQCNV